MRRVFVTVGTTPFEELISKVEGQEKIYNDFCFYYQTAQEKPFGRTGRSYSFLKRNEYLDVVAESEIVITHAGAGTVFSLLEMGKTLIVVPNLTRLDKHQSELASWLKSNNLAFVAKDVSELPFVMSEVINNPQKLDEYLPEVFFAHLEIADLINSSFKK